MSRLARAGFLVAFAAGLASSSARAAGPLAIYDAATRTPYAWDHRGRHGRDEPGLQGIRRQHAERHRLPRAPEASGAKQSIAVEWADDDLREHLEHGDTVGICGNGH